MKKSKKDSKTNWAKADAYVNKPADYEELPEWTDAMFESADLYVGKNLIRRGRPKKAVRAKSISLRLDPLVEKHFRAMGKGWQTQINKVLSEWVNKYSPKS
jgi:uncharacterized protein (DUF4415 family)